MAWLATALAVPGLLVLGVIPAQAGQATRRSAARPAAPPYPYTLVDPGTFSGGPQNELNLPGLPLSPAGALLGSADTRTRDTDFAHVNPFTVLFPDRYVAHAFLWRRGRLTDLGALPGNNSSAVFQVNAHGVGVGLSEVGGTDPQTAGWPAVHPVMFRHGHVIDLGTLRGGHEGFALSITGRGQVAGFGSNGKADRYPVFAAIPGVWHTQTRSFIWRNGKMHDIGSLGGPDTLMNWQNARGEITGQSYTSGTANTATGIPTQNPFLWDNGHMRNLGTLGGTVGFGNWINTNGEVVGCSDLKGDRVSRPFLWNGRRMRSLGSLGGPTGCANWIADSGIVAGYALTADKNFHGFWWRNGKMHDLKPIGGAPWAFANSVNDSGIVVGRETDTNLNELFAVLWNHGRAYNLNKLIAPARLRLTSAEYISNNGDIVGNAIVPNGDRRVFLLIRNHSVPLPAAGLPGPDGAITPLPAYTMRVAADTALPAALRWLLRLSAMRRVPA